MLVCEWHAWWRAIPAISAKEHIEQHTIAFLADAGWKIDDRSLYLADWRQLARQADPTMPPEPPQPDLRLQVRRVFAWLQSRYVGAGERGMGLGEG